MWTNRLGARRRASASNVDNLERAARSNIIDAHNLVTLATAIDAVPEETAILGICPECNQPTSEFVHENERQRVCEECATDESADE